MGFEFDNNKSRGNKRKHGIDLIEAQKLLHNNRIEILLKYLDKKILIIAKLSDKY